VLLAGGGDLTNQVEMVSDGVGAVGDDVVLQHGKHFHIDLDFFDLLFFSR